MSDDIELRRLAEAATPGPWLSWSRDTAVRTTDRNLLDFRADTPANAAFIAAANPTAVLALLDDLEDERQRRTNTFRMWEECAAKYTAACDERDALRAQMERVAAVLAAPGWHPRHAADEGCHICMFHGQLRAALDPQ